MANITKTDIINLALTNLGQDVISADNQNTATARRANFMYDFARRNLLRAHDWIFAQRTATLAESAAASPFTELPYVYALPADALFLKAIFYEGSLFKIDLKHRMFVSDSGQKLVACSFAGPMAVYIKDEDNPSLFEADFTACLALLLAAELAIPIAGDSNLAQLMLSKYQAALDNARLTNKAEQFERPARSSEFVEVR